MVEVLVMAAELNGLNGDAPTEVNGVNGAWTSPSPLPSPPLGAGFGGFAVARRGRGQGGGTPPVTVG